MIVLFIYHIWASWNPQGHHTHTKKKTINTVLLWINLKCYKLYPRLSTVCSHIFYVLGSYSRGRKEAPTERRSEEGRKRISELQHEHDKWPKKEVYSKCEGDSVVGGLGQERADDEQRHGEVSRGWRRLRKSIKPGQQKRGAATWWSWRHEIWWPAAL